MPLLDDVVSRVSSLIYDMLVNVHIVSREHVDEHVRSCPRPFRTTSGATRHDTSRQQRDSFDAVSRLSCMLLVMNPNQTLMQTPVREHGDDDGHT